MNYWKFISIGAISILSVATVFNLINGNYLKSLAQSCLVIGIIFQLLDQNNNDTDAYFPLSDLFPVVGVVLILIDLFSRILLNA